MSNSSASRHTALILLEFVCLSVLLALCVLVVYIDMTHFSPLMTEGSLTENAHFAASLISFALFAIGARRFPDKRGYLAAIAALFLMMAIRESDAMLDQISKGFWKLPVSAVFFIGAVIVYRNRHSVKLPLNVHFQTRGFAYLLVGFLIVVVYSRLLGSSNFWRPALGEAYNPVVKTVVQENAELLGYAVMLFGAVLSYLFRFGDDDRTDQS